MSHLTTSLYLGLPGPIACRWRASFNIHFISIDSKNKNKKTFICNEIKWNTEIIHKKERYHRYCKPIARFGEKKGVLECGGSVCAIYFESTCKYVHQHNEGNEELTMKSNHVILV